MAGLLPKNKIFNWVAQEGDVAAFPNGIQHGYSDRMTNISPIQTNKYVTIITIGGSTRPSDIVQLAFVTGEQQLYFRSWYSGLSVPEFTLIATT